MMTGVFIPTPSSRQRSRAPRCRRRNSSYRAAAACQPSSSTKLSSARRFIVMGRPQTGQRGTSPAGTAMAGTRPAGGSSSPAPTRNPWASTIRRTGPALS